MRKPLKYQIMLPMLGVMLATLVLFSVVDAWLAGRRARRQIEKQLRDIAVTLEQSTFPLTDRVLDQMHGLSGADFVVAHSDGSILACSDNVRASAGTLVHSSPSSSTKVALNNRVRVGNATYFYVPVNLRRVSSANSAARLHCFYPESDYIAAWREAVMPPVVLGTLSLVMVVTISSIVGRRVTRPIQDLSCQMERIARGEFVPLDVPERNDELQDLSKTVNRMTRMLAQYEEHVRKNERLRTLDQLGGGIAHQLRNSVTGCRMAVDLHQRHCFAEGEESLDIAIAQLELMEKYLRRFLSLGKRNDVSFTHVDVTDVVQDVLPLVRPRSAHLGVDLHWHPPEERLLTKGDADALSEAVVNLLLNAVEAAAERRQGNIDNRTEVWVSVGIERVSETLIRLEVWDSGVGPEIELQEKLFEALATGKRDGVGLGLAIVRDITERHGGTVGWRRENGATCFYLELPTITKDIGDAQVTCC